MERPSWVFCVTHEAWTFRWLSDGERLLNLMLRGAKQDLLWGRSCPVCYCHVLLPPGLLRAETGP